MVENTNSTILEVQGSFGFTYMVGIIPLNLRSQEMDKGVPHARAPPPPTGLDRTRAGRGRQAASGRGRGSFNSGLNLSVACLFVSCMRDLCPSATREQNHFRVSFDTLHGDRQLGFWGAFTRLSKTSSSW
jgi:hypothetical protein